MPPPKNRRSLNALQDAHQSHTSAAMQITSFFSVIAVAATNLSHDSSAYGQFLDSPFDGATVVLEENAQPYIAVPQVQSSPFANPWSIVLLPDRIIYRSYLAGSKESRLGTQSFHRNGDGKLWDSTLGGRFGLLRIGPRDQPLGFQIDVEGARTYDLIRMTRSMSAVQIFGQAFHSRTGGIINRSNLLTITSVLMWATSSY